MLCPTGEKKTLVAVGSINKVTHSYTAQYSITASGKLLPKAFLCLQESTDKFGPRVAEKVNRLTDMYKNLYVTCSKSGKLTNGIYKLYLQHVLKPYVENNKFCLVLDSWGGQTDMVMYDSMFTDDQSQSTCMVKVIPHLCQPCDVYFFRQVKNFISKLQNCHVLLETQQELHNRTDAITIHSLIHNQLSVPIFQAMLSYAWYASKLITQRRVFMNVNQVCFPNTIGWEKCVCAKVAFIQCAWCRKFICFQCFYDNHPMHCEGELQQSESENE